MNNKGISPVIATVIIVAVAIAVSIAVAFWMTGIVGLFTGFEQVQITSAIATDSDTILIVLKNTGTSKATIDYVLINGKIADENGLFYTDDAETNPNNVNTPFPSGGLAVDQGSTKTIKIKLHDAVGTSFTSGQSVEVKLHTASGKEYPKLVVLP